MKTAKSTISSTPLPGSNVGFWVLSTVLTVIGLALVFGLPLLLAERDEFGPLRAAAKGDLVKFEVFEAPRALPDRSLTMENGDTISVSSLLGKVYLVNFWATWCAPCREEMPSLARLQAAFDPAHFEVVLVSLDREGFAVATPFLKEVGVDHLRSLLDRTNSLTLQLGGSGLPITILVDAHGRWIGRMDGPAEWDGPDGMRFIQTALDVLKDER